MSGHAPLSLAELKKAAQSRKFDFVKLDESGHEIQIIKFMSLEGEIWDDYLFERDLNKNLLQTARMIIALGCSEGEKHMFFDAEELPADPDKRVKFILDASLQVPTLFGMNDLKQLCNAITEFNSIPFKLTRGNEEESGDEGKKSDT